MEQHRPLMTGRVLDIGGKKKESRGDFRPDVARVDEWLFLNIDATTSPDFCCSADKIPLGDCAVNTIIFTELIEYLPDPVAVFCEARRVLAKDGVILGSSPFLVAIHGDAGIDRARYTPVMIKQFAESSGLEVHSIEPMGSLGAILFDLLHVSSGYAGGDSVTSHCLKFVLRLRWPFRLLDSVFSIQKTHITSGYFFVLKKKREN